jgi:hypothetical protein
MAREQTYANHRRWYLLYHFVAQPILIANLVVAVRRAVVMPTHPNWWGVVVAVGLEALAVASRTMALTVQNRVVRLEQWIRLGAVLPPDLKPRISELRLGQLLGLRFASDAELPDLVRRCLAGELRGADQVKREVKSWQPDHLRA